MVGGVQAQEVWVWRVQVEWQGSGGMGLVQGAGGMGLQRTGSRCFRRRTEGSRREVRTGSPWLRDSACHFRFSGLGFLGFRF